MSDEAFLRELLTLRVPMERLARRMNRYAPPEDMAQEALIRAWRGRALYSQTKPLAAWVGTILSNVVKDRARYDRRRVQMVSAEERVPGTEIRYIEIHTDPAADAAMQAVEDRDEIDRAVAVLRFEHPGMYDAWHLTDVDGMGSVEAAKILGIQETTVRTRVHRARLILRGLLKEAA